MPFPVEEKQIEATEQKLGAKFPQSFRHRMMRENGGEVDASDDTWTLHPFRDASDRKRLARTCNDILRETEQRATWRGWPGNALCIASNGAGDHLVYLIDEGAIGPIVFAWWHETGELQKLADDFAELLEL
jgi:hypothetical protein